MSKSKDVTTTTTQNNSIPDWLTNAAKGIASGVTSQPQYAPYTGELAPNMAGNQSLANTLMPGLLGRGVGIIANCVGGASNAANFSAPQMTAGGVGSMTQGLLSPYTQNVVDATNNEIDRSATINQQNNDAKAAAAHAFGGDRAGVMDAENTRNFNTIKANTDAQLYGSGFTQAENAALGIGQANQNASIYGAGINATGANALGNLGNLTQNANISDISGLLTTGGVAQTTQGNQDTAGYAAHNNNFLLPAQLQQLFAGSLGALPHDMSMNGTSTTPVTSNWGMGLLGAGLGLAGLAMPGGGSLGGGLIGGLLH